MPIFPKSSTYRKLFPIHDSEEKVLRFRLGQENGKGKVTDMEMISREHGLISRTEVIAQLLCLYQCFHILLQSSSLLPALLTAY